MAGLIPRTDLLIREVEGQTVILDREADLIHTLNPTASFIWNTLHQNNSLQDIVQSLVDAFEVEPAKAVDDVEAVLDNFRELRLIQST